jgi:hypothetical protein
LGDQIEKNKMGGSCSAYGGEEHTELWWGNLRESDHSEDPGVEESIILRWNFRKWDAAWTGLIWLRIGKDGGLL